MPTAEEAEAEETRTAAAEAEEHEEESVASEKSSARVSGDLSEFLPQILRALAETQRDMAKKTTTGGPSRQKMLAMVKVEDFSGGKGVSAKAYRNWKKGVGITQE